MAPGGVGIRASKRSGARGTTGVAVQREFRRRRRQLLLTLVARLFRKMRSEPKEVAEFRKTVAAFSTRARDGWDLGPCRGRLEVAILEMMTGSM
jgi:hypothetical protein